MNTRDPISAPTPPAQPRSLPVLLVPAIVTGLLLLAAVAFEWQLVDWLTGFMAPFVTAAAGLLFFGVSIGALVEAVVGLWHRQFRRLLPLGICLVVFAAAVYVPWTSVMLDADFALFRRDRNEVVRQCQQGRLKPDPRFHTGLIKLPARYRHLSAGGGEIVVEGTTIVFFTYRGILDNFSGFVYSPQGEPDGILLGSQVREVEHLNGAWYWVSAS